MQATGVPVRITLACGWCSRRLDDLPGTMETAYGRMSVHPTASALQLRSGRPVCPECNGPLFVDDWTVVRPRVEYEGPDTDDAEEREADGLVAA
jgi:hypothetical protein